MFDYTILSPIILAIGMFVLAIIEIWYKPKWDYKKELKIRVITSVFPKILGELRVTIDHTKRSYHDYYHQFDVFPYLTDIITSGEIEYVNFIDEALYTDLNDQYSKLKPMLDTDLRNKSDFKRKIKKSWDDFLSSKDEITFNADNFIGWCKNIEFYAWKEESKDTGDSIREGYDEMRGQRVGVSGLSEEYIEEMTELTIKIAQDLKENREDLEKLFVNNIELNIIPKIEQYLRKPV